MCLFIKKENYQQTNTEKKCFLIIKKNIWITKQQQQLINFWFIAPHRGGAKSLFLLELQFLARQIPET